MSDRTNPTHPLSSGNIRLMALVTAVVSFVFYYLTCHPSITWWTNPVLSLSANTLGITHPPGALLPTIAGFIVTRVAAAGSEAYLLNLFSGLLAATTTALVLFIAAGLFRSDDLSDVTGSPTGPSGPALIIGIAVGALTLAFGQTFWLYAVKFTPYMMTALFTALLLWAMIRWWNRADSGHDLKWLLLIAFLFGLDISVHRTNLLLAPGLAVWIMLKRPRTFLSVKAWAAGIIGFAAGFSFHLLIIPMAAAEPFMNSGSPDSLGAWWNYVTLKQYGGGFLVNLWPRKAPFIGVQLADYLRAFGLNFMQWRGEISILGVLPVICGIFGLIRLWLKDSRLALGLLVLFLATSLGAVIYFNVPENFIRAMYRHYLPSFVIFAVLIGYGAGSVILILSKQYRQRWMIYCPAAILLLVLPGTQISANYSLRDCSQRNFAHDYALNYLTALEENAILITYGDNDTHPLWYMQVVEGIRPDVAILNINLLNTSWYVKQVLDREINLPLTLTPEQVAKINAKPWSDTLITLPVTGVPSDFQLDDSIELPDSIHLQVPPGFADRYLLVQDWLLLQMLEENNWQRPIYFSSAGGGRIPDWLTPYLRMEGLVFRLVPIESPPLNLDLLYENLIDKYAFRGYDDFNLALDDVAKSTGQSYLSMFLRLAGLAYEKGDEEKLAMIKQKLHTALPLKRLQPLQPGMEEYIKALLDNDINNPEDRNESDRK